MVIKEISKSEFDSFSKTHVLGSFFNLVHMELYLENMDIQICMLEDIKTTN